MMKVTIGVLLGVTISAVAGYIILPKKMQAEYERGVADGTRSGAEAGMAKGKAMGRQEGRAEYQHEQEVAQASARSREEERRQDAAKERKAAPKPTQNWHVRGNQLQEPVGDGTPKTPTIKGDDTPA